MRNADFWDRERESSLVFCSFPEMFVCDLAKNFMMKKISSHLLKGIGVIILYTVYWIGFCGGRSLMPGNLS